MHSSSSSPGFGSAPHATTVFRGRYSDGVSAVAHDAEVRLTASGVEITLLGDRRRVVWPLATLRSAQPLGARSQDVLIGTNDNETSSLFVPDPVFATRLATVVPSLTTRSQRWRHARPWLMAGAAVAAVIGGIAALDLSPARAVARLLPDKAREVMGTEAVRSMSSGRRQCDAATGRAALDRLTQRLAPGRPDPGRPDARRFKVVVVDWSLMNAFAVPGDKIVLTRGLLARTESADEVAGVLAHEMGHAIELHPEAAMVRALGMTAVADLVFGSGTLTNLGVLLAQLSYSRDAETQADRRALELLRGAAITPQGLADFFRRVMKIEGDMPGAPKSGPLSGRAMDVLSTHPATEERLRIVERQPTYDATPALTSEEWQALRDICGAATPSGPVPKPGGGTAKPSPPKADGGMSPGSPTPKPSQPRPNKPAPPGDRPPPKPGVEKPIEL